MTSTNLTRTEAAARAELISNVHYDITLDLTQGRDMERTTFRSTATITFRSSTGSTFLDLRAEQIHTVNLDGADITAEAVPMIDGSYNDTAGIQLDNLTAGDHILTVSADACYSTTGQGLHRFQDPADNEVYMYTQFETADAKRVFACFDQPDIKATYNVEVLTPSEWTVVTNNVVSTSNVAAADATSGAASAARHTSTVDYPLSTYLIAFCVGPWYVARDEWRGHVTAHPETDDSALTAARGKAELITDADMTVPLALYCRKSLAEYMDTEELFEVTKQGFDFYAEHFGVGYPFYKYDQIFCPEYNMGAMENAGCVTIRDEYIFRSAASHYQRERRADTILHELAHMWFGDLVTMKWWDDLWLNESFATWSAAMAQSSATKYHTAWVTFASKEKAWAYSQDQLSSTHPIFSDASDIVTVDANFDGITYAKGASVLKQLAAYVGLDAFLAGLRAHFAAHAWDNATFDDLLGHLECASGRDLSTWADQWLRTTGINTLTPRFEIAEGRYTSFIVEQSGAEPGAGETRVHRIAVGVYATNGSGELVRTKRVELDIDGAATSVDELVGAEAGELVLVNDDDLTYGFMALDEASLATATGQIDKITDPMARSLVWSAAWQMTRNAQMRARDFTELVARGAVAETELAVLEQVLAQGRTAVARYADETWAAEQGWALLREAYLDGARQREGAAQLAFARAYAGCVLDSEAAETLRAALDSTPGDSDSQEVFPGLDVDQDLRWAFLIALSGAGEVAETPGHTPVAELIDTEEKADGTSAGAMHALHARSAAPTAEVKEQVWEDITVHGPERSNLVLRHRIAGFAHIGHGELLQPYGARYAESAVRVWEALSSEMALRTLEGIYPDWDASDATDSAIMALLAEDTTPAGLRRVLAEGRDRVARAKAARTFDRMADHSRL